MQGVYAASLAGFICWMAGEHEVKQATFRADHARYRTHLQRAGHKRTTDAGAQLLATWRALLTFALEVGAISEPQQKELWRRVTVVMREALMPQASYQAHSDPVARFSELLLGILASRRAHLSDFRTGQCPGEGWGWEPYEVGLPYGGSGARHRPKGFRIGWLDDNDLYLEPAATYAELQRFAKEQGESISVTPTTLWKRLNERGLVASREGTHMTVQRSPAGMGRKRVLHLDLSMVEKTGATGASGVYAVGDSTSLRATSEEEVGQAEEVGQPGQTSEVPVG